MNATLRNVQISAIAAALPEQRLALMDLAARYGELEVRRIIKSTGIESVRIAGGLSTGDLCEAAATSLLDQCAVSRKSIDAVILVTQTPDFIMPATSTVLQHRLGLPNSCLAFDINYGCSGYIYGLYQAALLVSAGNCRRVLLCTGDVITKLLHEDDRNVRMVFGDAATATLVEAGSDSMDFVIRSDGSGAKCINTPITYANCAQSSCRGGHIYMDGAGVMGFALGEVPSLVKELLERVSLSPQTVDLFVLHQANAFMLDYLRRAIGAERRRLPICVKDVGNTGPSSIPLALTLAQEDINVNCAEVVCCGFGVGLSSGAVRTSMIDTRIIGPVDVVDGPGKSVTPRAAVVRPAATAAAH